jgi:tRNA 2-thiouridine synthesizing protein E
MADFIEFNDKKIAVDKNGYLENHNDWTEDLAYKLAETEQVELSDAHWEVVRFVRAFYEEYDTSPAIRVLVKQLAKEFGPDKGNSRYVQRLFPKGPAKQATKIAGLPKPAKCL